MTTSIEKFVYVGLKRTASSFLQEKILPKIKRYNRRIAYEKFINIGKPLYDKYLRLPNFDKIVSVGESYSDCHTYPLFRDSTWFYDRYDWISKVKKMYPDMNVIVSFRDKESHIMSLYNKYCYDKGKFDYDNYVNVAVNNKDYSDYYDYDRYVKALKDAFDNVLVLDYAELVSDPDVYIKRICDFIGVKMIAYDNVFVNASSR